MGGVCGIGSIKGRLSPIESLSGTLSIPVGGILDCDIYDPVYDSDDIATDEELDDVLTDVFG